jgi:hypothetical protein
MPDQSRPPLSVVVPTRSRWPAIEPLLDAMHRQLVAVGAELVIVDGTVDGCALDHRDPRATVASGLVQVVPSPGSDVFELRALGLVQANGRIVAMIEDHCVPEPEYLDALLRAHAQHAEQAVAGAVINGSTNHLIDRVNFLLVHARNVPPRDSVPGPGWIPTSSNVSYKRAAIPTDRPKPGWIETVHNVALLHDGQVAFDDRIVVRHIQSSGKLGTFKNHFHAGKSMGGLARTAIGGRAAQGRWALRATLSLPVHLVRPIWQLQRPARSRRALLPVVSIAAALSTADAVGFACGVIAGPGRSLQAVR